MSGPALRIGTAALGDAAWSAGTIGRLSADQRRLDGMLEAAGFTVLGGTPLFRLARHVDAIGIVEALGRAGIHVRAFPREPQWLRFGMPGEMPAWHRLSAALAAWSRQSGRI